MSEPIAVALITAAQAITLALLGMLAKRLSTVKNYTKETKDQMVNHHPKNPNFREENDRRHNETRNWFRLLFNRQEKLFERVEKIDSDNVMLLEYALENRQRIEDVEDTQKGSKK